MSGKSGAVLREITTDDRSVNGRVIATDELSLDELAMVSGGKTVVSSGVLNGKAISKPQPAYPPIA